MDNGRAVKIAKYYFIVFSPNRRMPISLQVALTDSCFNRCIGCGHPSRVQRQMELQKWLDFLSLAKAYDLESVCYSGGDPMAYAGFNAVMSKHIELEMPFGMTITGYVPKGIDMQLLRRAAWVRCSLDAVTPDVYALVRGHTPVSKVIASIDAMIAAGVNVELGVTMHPDNEEELPNVRRFAADRGLRADYRYAYPRSNPRWPDIEMEGRGVLPFNRCSAARYQLYIDSDGSVYPCCIVAGDTRTTPQGHALANLFSDDWDTVWRAAIEFSSRNRDALHEVCRTCCVKRLSEINNVCDSISNANEQSFF